jgi:crotonobetainyl-CoA:carnitine CoA-transferase CaiB-like acyl-CoA transferase
MAHEILEGIRVLDLTAHQLGPVNTMMLAAMGAEVIKIEPPAGEAGRGRAIISPDVVRGGEGKGLGGENLSAYFETNNRCKKGIVLDLKRPRAREVLHQLVAKSDVFVQNMRHGVADKLGCGYETLKKYNPRLIYCHGTSFGTKGPDAAKPGFDMSGMARSGWMYMAPSDAGEPICALGGSSDQMGAIFGSYAVVAALYARERFGLGQEVETSHLTASMWLLGLRIQMHYYGAEPILPHVPRERFSNPIFNSYKCAGGEWICLACTDNNQWADVCEALGLPESSKLDPRFSTSAARKENARECISMLDKAFARKRREEWIKRFEGTRIFWEKVQRMEDVDRDPQVIANEYMTDYTHPLTGQSYQYLHVPMQFSETPAMRQGRAPLLGEHTEEIMVEILGYKAEDLPKLLDEIGRPDSSLK